MNLISTYASAYCKYAKPLTKEQELRIRDSKPVKDCYKLVREALSQGKKEEAQRLKKCNQYVLAHGTSPDKTLKTIERCNKNLIHNGKVCLDFDEDKGSTAILDMLRGKEEELGVLRIENSARYGKHVFVRGIKDFTIAETIKWWEAYTGMKIDSIKDVSCAVFLAPNDECFYCAEDYFSTTVEPISLESLPDIGFSLDKEEKMDEEIAKAKAYYGGYTIKDYSALDYDGTDNADRLRHDIEEVILPNCIDLTQDNKDWAVRIASVLVNELPEYEAREYYHKLSSFYPGYDYNECEKRFDYILRHPYPYHYGTFKFLLNNCLTNNSNEYGSK